MHLQSERKENALVPKLFVCFIFLNFVCVAPLINTLLQWSEINLHTFLEPKVFCFF